MCLPTALRRAGVPCLTGNRGHVWLQNWHVWFRSVSSIIDDPAKKDQLQQTEVSISVDRSGLVTSVPHTHEKPTNKQPESEVIRQLKALIKFRGGPITLAEYMSEALTNATAGYYINRDVFGIAGDFVTSPEISQMFGEMVGIWCVSVWQQLSKPKAFRLLELGPGRGTMMCDLLRGTSVFPQFTQAAQVHLVEVSTALRQKQWETLKCGGEPDFEGGSFQGVTSPSGCPVTWHRSVDDVPSDLPTIAIAHELLDALPVHQFERNLEGRWRERLVDVDSSASSPFHFRVVLARGETAALRLLLGRRLSALDPKLQGELKQLEVCPQGMALAQSLAERVGGQQRGAALIIDYGKDGPYEESLQAIRHHDVVSLLDSPGSADISAWVDFDAIRQAVNEAKLPVRVHGPITQQHFLVSLGIANRLQALAEAATSDEQVEQLIDGARRLVEGNESDGMGESYKVMAITHQEMGTPATFEPPPTPLAPNAPDAPSPELGSGSTTA